MAAKKSKYSIEDRFNYHNDRYLRSGPNGLKYGGTKHCYSMGFVDAFSYTDNTVGTRYEFGDKSAIAYLCGYRIAEKARSEYIKKTGKDPRDLSRKWQKKRG